MLLIWGIFVSYISLTVWYKKQNGTLRVKKHTSNVHNIRWKVAAISISDMYVRKQSKTMYTYMYTYRSVLCMLSLFVHAESSLSIIYSTYSTGYTLCMCTIIVHYAKEKGPLGVFFNRSYKYMTVYIWNSGARKVFLTVLSFFKKCTCSKAMEEPGITSIVPQAVQCLLLIPILSSFLSLFLLV